MADVLGHIRPQNAVKKHCKHAKLLKGVESTGLTLSPRGLTIIPESDLYRLESRSFPARLNADEWLIQGNQRILNNDSPWFVAKDVCGVLNINSIDSVVS